MIRRPTPTEVTVLYILCESVHCKNDRTVVLGEGEHDGSDICMLCCVLKMNRLA